MSSFYAVCEQMSVSAHSIQSMSTSIGRIGGNVNSVRRNLTSVISPSYSSAIDRSLNRITEDIHSLSRAISSTASVLESSRQYYEEADRRIAGESVTVARRSTGAPAPRFTTSLISALKQGYSWKDVIKSFGNIGKAAGIVISIFAANKWTDWAKIGINTLSTGYSFWKDVVNYAKIGRAIGGKNATAYFLKKAIGFRNVGHASQCKSITSRFYNNLHNKTSPYNLKDAFSSFTGKKGVVRTCAAWAGVALTGVVNAFSNLEEQKASGGKMSTGRVVAETITETAIDTVVAYAGTAVVGAAITAVTGVVAAPAVVAIATGVGLAVINAGVKKLTGKSATEFVSDLALDTGKAVWEGGKKLVTGAGKCAKSVARWFKKRVPVFA